MAMAEARSRADWSRTSHVLAMMANANRDREKKPEPFTPADFDPYAPKIPPAPKPKLKMADVKDLLGGMIGKRSG